MKKQRGVMEPWRNCNRKMKDMREWEEKREKGIELITLCLWSRSFRNQSTIIKDLCYCISLFTKRRKSGISKPLRNSRSRQKKEMVLAYVTYRSISTIPHYWVKCKIQPSSGTEKWRRSFRLIWPGSVVTGFQIVERIDFSVEKWREEGGDWSILYWCQ